MLRFLPEARRLGHEPADAPVPEQQLAGGQFRVRPERGRFLRPANLIRQQSFAGPVEELVALRIAGLPLMVSLQLLQGLDQRRQVAAPEGVLDFPVDVVGVAGFLEQIVVVGQRSLAA